MFADRAPLARHWLAVLGAAIGGLTLVAQFFLTLDLRMAAGFGIAASVVFFLSFFTILTNIMVFLCFASEFVAKPRALAGFFRRPSTRSAVAVYITVVALVYIFVLQHMWNPEGLAKFLDRLLHYVMPALYLLFWLLFVPKGTMRFAQDRWWMAYPLAYGLYAMLRGALTASILTPSSMQAISAMQSPCAILGSFSFSFSQSASSPSPSTGGSAGHAR